MSWDLPPQRNLPPSTALTPKKSPKPSVGDESNIFTTVYSCEVLSINDAAQTATVRLHYRAAAEIPPPHQRPFQVGPIGSDAGGIYFEGGKVHHIPPYGPVTQIMQQLVAYTDALSVNDTGLRTLAQADALNGIVRHAAEALRALDPIRTPAPDPNLASTQTKAAKSAQPEPVQSKPKARSK